MSDIDRDLEALAVLRDHAPVPAASLAEVQRRGRRIRWRRRIGRVVTATALLTGIAVMVPVLRSTGGEPTRVSTNPAGPGAVECSAPAEAGADGGGPRVDLASGWQRFDGAEVGLGDRGQLTSVAGTPDGRLLAVGAVDQQPAVWLGDEGAWSRVESEAFLGEGQITDIASHGRRYIAVGVMDRQQTVWWSEDGLSWESTNLGEAGALRAVTNGSTGMIAVGQAGPVSGIAGTPGGAASAPAVWRSPDGRSWRREDAATPSFAYMDDVACTASGFVAVGQHNGKPATWTRHPKRWELTDLPGGGALHAVAASGVATITVGWDQQYRATAWRLTNDGPPARADEGDLGSWYLAALARTPAGIVGVGGTRQALGLVPRMFAADPTGDAWTSLALDEAVFPIGASLTDVARIGDRVVIVGSVGGLFGNVEIDDEVARLPSAPAVWTRPDTA